MTAVDVTGRGLAWKLYHGETAFDFVGRRKAWFTFSAALILLGVVFLGARGLNFGIDFRGGTNWEVPAHGVSLGDVRRVVGDAGVKAANVQTLKGRNGTDVRVQANVSPAEVPKVQQALATLTKSSVDAVTVKSVGPTWGHEITRKAEVALIAFFIAVGAFITFRFQAKMALAAIIAVIHDILVTVGVYAVFGFDVTPNTVIAILTILGYSLYDTVVVFDKVDENTKGLAASGRMTYSDTVNVSMNQVLMRSLNTSFVAILPILSVLIIGDAFLGATTLKEFGLALFVGLLTGAYSSIFIAAPILAILKEREPRYATIRARLEARGATGAILTPRAAAQASIGTGTRARNTAGSAPTGDDGDGVAGAGTTPTRRTTTAARTATTSRAATTVETPAGGAASGGTTAPGRLPEGGGGGAASAGGAATPAGSGAQRPVGGPGGGVRPRPSAQRPPPRGRKKGGKHR